MGPPPHPQRRYPERHRPALPDQRGSPQRVQPAGGFKHIGRRPAHRTRGSGLGFHTPKDTSNTKAGEDKAATVRLAQHEAITHNTLLNWLTVHINRYFCEPHHNFGVSTEIVAEHPELNPPDRPLRNAISFRIHVVFPRGAVHSSCSVEILVRLLPSVHNMKRGKRA